MTIAEPDLPPARRILRTALVFLALFFTIAALAWYSGVFSSEFGRYQDEGMHYVTGLFIEDFITSGHWTTPMQFAREYYLHVPKIALGNWPPGFPLMQAAWGLVFGDSRVSMMWGMVVLTAWLALLVFRTGASFFGSAMGAAGALLLIASLLTQEQTAMVMAEIPLAAASFLAICAFVRFVESGNRADALWFAFWTFAAIMIKGNGWVIGLAAPGILLAMGQFRLLLNRWLWVSVLVLGVLTVPYTLVTMHIVTGGWDTRTFPGWAYEFQSLGIHLGFVAGILGIPLTVLALYGAGVSVVRRDLFRTSMVIYGIAIVVFHVAIPSSIEPRKIYQIAPVMCLLALVGMDSLIRMLPAVPFARPAAAALLVIVFSLTGFKLLPRYEPGFGRAVESIIARPESRGAAILISSNPQWADTEAGIIAEWAERRRNDGTYLIRGTKLLSHPFHAKPGEPEFELNFTSQADLLKALASIPVAFVMLDTVVLKGPPAPVYYPHHALLKAALDGDAADWERVYSSQKDNHTIEVYRRRQDLRGVPIHYSVDLTGKVGAELSTQ